jgi:transcriptional regulator with GAF, ATPase, and Fis domain
MGNSWLACKSKKSATIVAFDKVLRYANNEASALISALKSPFTRKTRVSAEISALIRQMLKPLSDRRLILILPGLLIFLYSIAILYRVQVIPDLGLRSAFSTKIRQHRLIDADPSEPVDGSILLLKVGDKKIQTWVDVLQAPFHLAKERDRVGNLAEHYPEWARRVNLDGVERDLIKVWFIADPETGEQTASAWCVLGSVSLESQIPSILWFLLKLSLFVVGALVLWKRPYDPASTQFYLLCAVTLGAYMGGYHWTHIATQPWMLVVFMVCAVLLPAVSLHFFLIFPRRKRFLEASPGLTLTGVYGVPLLFLAVMTVQYVLLRQEVQAQQVTEASYESLVTTIRFYFWVAAAWYLSSVVSLLRSFRSVSDPTEKNQVKWILFGAVLAMAPIGYSLYLALEQPEAFAAGGATWPMFFASFCFTAAFAISITRYRLMELDKIVSSGMAYFLVSFLAALLYYAIVFLGTVVFNQGVARPRFTEAIAVSTTALLLMFAIDLARSRFKKVLDRRFSRDKTQLDHTLQRLGEAVEQLVDPPALAQKLLHTSSELLAAKQGAVYLRRGEPPIYRLAASIGAPPALEELAPGFPLLTALETGKPVVNDLRPGVPASAAQRQLQFLGAEVAQPVCHENRVLAILLLGQRSAPFRPEDLDLLGAFAQITAAALESAEGHRTIEQLNQELQAKVQKIAEQQRRILALQTQLRRQVVPDTEAVAAAAGEPVGVVAEAVQTPAPAGIVGSSPVVHQLLHLVRKVAATDAVVLIGGESGTGKELLARAVHETSNRAGKPYVKVHCAALSASLLESELFGHVKGAFTGAHRDKVGRFELANGGTLFLDEIGDVTLEVQTKLLRVLQEKTIERVGSADPMQVDVRIIAATHQDLERLIRQGRFREDLFYRLNVFPIEVPPLRDRPEDVVELAMHFVRLSSERCHKNVRHIDDDALAVLKGHSWPGNIRQLENVIERAVVIAEADTITVAELPHELFHEEEHDEAEEELMASVSRVTEPAPHGYAAWRSERQRLERDQLVRALAAANGNKAEAARALGIARSTLVSRLKKLRLS